MAKLVGLGIVSGLLVVALVLLEPWRAFTSSTRDEPVPVGTALDPAPGAAPGSTPGVPSPGGAGASGSSDVGTPPPLVLPEPPPVPIEVASGELEAAEHATSGRARVIEVSDGRRFVRLEGLDTSDGPDLHVWLSEVPSGGEWGSYDDGRFVELGPLKATRGNHNYEVPAGADLVGLRSVVIWCDRFDVAFGTAPVDLRRPAGVPGGG